MPRVDTDLADFVPFAEESAPMAVFAKPWAVAGVAILVGLAIDTVALHQPPGLGLMLGLWLALLVAGSLTWLLGVPRPKMALPVLVAGLTVAAFVGIRTSPVLLTLNIATALGLVAVLAQLHKAGGISGWTIVRYWRQPFATLGDMVAGSSRFIAIDLRDGFGEDHSKRLRSVALGLLLGVPLLIVFGGLFASADLVFGDYLNRLATSVLFGSVFWRGALSLATALAVAGLWRTARGPRHVSQAQAHRRRLDPTTGVTVLALLIMLFLLFVLTQVIGHDPELVRIADYSENARRGFFQLVVVALLVLNVLLAFDWLTRTDNGRRSPAFDRLAVVLIILTGIVMLSALERMRVYVTAFGFTELRFYTTVFMFWLAFVLVWFIRTVLRNRHALFAAGLMASGLVFIIGLNVANPDAMIVRLNWDRQANGSSFEDRYNSELSVDSVLTLIAIRESEPVGRWCFIEERLLAAQRDLDSYWRDHGLLGDSWAAWRVRTALADLDLSPAIGLDCGDPRAANRND